MTQSASPSELMTDLFVSLGFTRARIDRLETERLLELLVNGLKAVTPADTVPSATVRVLTERLELLRQGAVVQTLPKVASPLPVQDDPDDEAHLRRQIASSRARVQRQIDEERKLQATGT